MNLTGSLVLWLRDDPTVAIHNRLFETFCSSSESALWTVMSKRPRRHRERENFWLRSIPPFRRKDAGSGSIDQFRHFQTPISKPKKTLWNLTAKSFGFHGSCEDDKLTPIYGIMKNGWQNLLPCVTVHSGGQQKARTKLKSVVLVPPFSHYKVSADGL